MRYTTALVGLVAAIIPVSSARSLVVPEDSSPVQVAGDDLKIPGDSPLELCNKDHNEDVITIQSVDLVPNPPQAGEVLAIKAVGTVKDTIEEGAYVLLQVKYGLIRLISQKADLCEQIQNVDMECPIEKGIIALTKEVELPREIPPGRYTVFADVYSKDDEPITCLTAHVVFSMGGLSSNDQSSFFNIEL